MSLKGTKSTVSYFISRAFLSTAHRFPFIQKEENLAVSRQREGGYKKSLRHGNSESENPHSIEITDIRGRVLRGKKVELVKRPLSSSLCFHHYRVLLLYKKNSTNFILSGVGKAWAQLLGEKERFMQLLLLSLKLFLGASEGLTGGTSSSPPLLLLMESLIRRR